MRKPENTFIGSVHKHLPDTVYRIKNHNSFSGGEPDCWYSGRGGDLWIEYKFSALPRRDDSPIGLIGGKSPLLSALQQKWLRERHAEGRQVGVVVGCVEGGVWLPGLMWDAAYTAGQFRPMLMSRARLAELITHLVG